MYCIYCHWYLCLRCHLENIGFLSALLALSLVCEVPCFNHLVGNQPDPWMVGPIFLPMFTLQDLLNFMPLYLTFTSWYIKWKPHGLYSSIQLEIHSRRGLREPPNTYRANNILWRRTYAEEEFSIKNLMHLELNKSENTACKLVGCNKTVLWGKLINGYIWKEENPKAKKSMLNIKCREAKNL